MAGEKRYLGIAQESVFGTPVPAVQFLDFVSAQIDTPTEPQIVFGGSVNRALQTVDAGAYVPSGSIEVPVDLESIGYFLKWALGSWYTEATLAGASTTLAAAANKGDGTVTVNSEAGFSVNDYVQVGEVVDGNEPEIAQIQALDGGAGPTYTWTLAANLQKDHGNAEDVQEGAAPFKHTYWHTGEDNLPFLTLRVGKQYFEHAFAGASISRLAFSMERGFLTATMDLVAQKDLKGALDSSSKTLPASLLSFRHGKTDINENLDGSAGGGFPLDVTSLVESYSLEINNNIDEEEGVRHGSRFAQEFFVGGIDISGSLTLAFKDTAEYERFWADAAAPSATALKEFILEERLISGAYYLALITTRAHYTQVRAPSQGRERIRQELSFRGVNNDSWLGPITVWLNNTTSVYPA